MTWDKEDYKKSKYFIIKALFIYLFIHLFILFIYFIFFHFSLRTNVGFNPLMQDGEIIP